MSSDGQRYTWSQTYDFVTITIDNIPDISKKDIRVSVIAPNHLNVSLMGEHVCGGSLDSSVYATSTWSFVSSHQRNKQLVIELDKVDTSKWWKRLFDHETPINGETGPRFVADLPEEERRKIEKQYIEEIEKRKTGIYPPGK